MYKSRKDSFSECKELNQATKLEKCILSLSRWEETKAILQNISKYVAVFPNSGSAFSEELIWRMVRQSRVKKSVQIWRILQMRPTNSFSFSPDEKDWTDGSFAILPNPKCISTENFTTIADKASSSSRRRVYFWMYVFNKLAVQKLKVYNCHAVRLLVFAFALITFIK